MKAFLAELCYVEEKTQARFKLTRSSNAKERSESFRLSGNKLVRDYLKALRIIFAS